MVSRALYPGSWRWILITGAGRLSDRGDAELGHAVKRRLRNSEGLFYRVDVVGCEECKKGLLY